MREIVPGVFTWPWFSEKHGYDFNGHLVLHEGGNLAIDPVEFGPGMLDALAARGVAQILLTNRNHFRAAEALRLRTGARVLVHAEDAAFVRSKGVEVGGALEHGAQVGPFTVVDASGKSPGEVALLWPERRLLLVGDACVGKSPGVLGLLPPAVIDDLPRLHRSLARLAALDVETLLVGDGHSVLAGAAAALGALVASLPR
jgi:glyoxylase-like metal-dependent hydrolase (beta-lactamase superfamily II)